MPRIAPLALALLTVSAPSFAQTAKAPGTAHSATAAKPAESHTAEAVSPAKKQKAAELMGLMKSDKQVEDFVTHLRETLQQAAAQRTAGHDTTPEEKKATADYKSQVQALEDSLDYQKIKAALVEQYASAFTDQQLDGIITFYRSPSGQALINKLPEVQQGTNKLMSEKITTLRTEFIQDTQAYMAKVTPETKSPSLNPPAVRPQPVTPPVSGSGSSTPQH